MMLSAKRLFRLFLLIVSMPLSAQVEWCGEVRDMHGAPLEYASVALLTCDSVLIGGTVTDSVGHFCLASDSVDTCIVKVSNVGYSTVYKNAFGNNLIISLTPIDNQLGEVVVKGHRPTYRNIVGGYEAVIQGSVYEIMSNVGEILSFLPKVNANSDGSYSVFGRGTSVVYIDGRKITDVQELQRIDSKDIKSISVLSNPGSAYDSEYKAVILIKMKARQGEGLSGVVDATNLQKYKAGYSSHVSLNYRKKRFDIFGALSLLNVPSHVAQTMDQNINGSLNDVNLLVRNMLQNQRLSQVKYNVGANLVFGSDHSAGFRFSISDVISPAYMKVSYMSQVLENQHMVGEMDYRSHVLFDYKPTYELNAYYNGSLGHWDMKVDLTYFKNDNTDKISTTERSAEMEDRDINILQNTAGEMFASKAVGIYQLNSSVSFEVGMEYVNSKDRQKYRNAEGYVEATDDDIKEDNVAGFANITGSFGDFDFTVGSRYEYIVRNYYSYNQRNGDGHKKYSQWFPNIDLSYSFSSGMQLGLTFTGRASRPSYSALSNMINYNSRFLYEGGNPNLKTTFNDVLEFNMGFKWLTFSLGYEYIKNPIVKWAKNYSTNSDVVLLYDDNILRRKNVYANLVLAPSLGIWRPMLNVYAQKQFIDNNGIDAYLKKIMLMYKVDNNFLFKDGTLVGISYVGNNRYNDGFTSIGKSSELSVYISKSFCKQRLSVTVKANDIFNQSKQVVDMFTPCYKLNMCKKYDTRSFLLSVRYRFNTASERYKGTGAGLDERSRF